MLPLHWLVPDAVLLRSAGSTAGVVEVDGLDRIDWSGPDCIDRSGPDCTGLDGVLRMLRGINRVKRGLQRRKTGVV